MTGFRQFAGTRLGAARNTVDLGDGNDVFVGSGQNVADTPDLWRSCDDTISVRSPMTPSMVAMAMMRSPRRTKVPNTATCCTAMPAMTRSPREHQRQALWRHRGRRRLWRGNADTLDGGDGADYLDGGDGNDVINFGTGNNTVYGGAGMTRSTMCRRFSEQQQFHRCWQRNDTAWYGEGNSTVYGALATITLMTRGRRAIWRRPFVRW